ncbi:hypothetical protein HJG54_26600 [Leptolyngbya sp. NK1-12]|uniref:Amino acid permease n=1 Tax=Leptolyngbya sp. NK1-12 TaxID=2547451 RepID=A0AA97ARX0_9CYAN|nr:hypothetical protein [Leptolyngbya sp. NK1-12]WNZ26043.1 hypothetical protein HJG54_26600 [Leptolyngbya sp. NK1-12]
MSKPFAPPKIAPEAAATVKFWQQVRLRLSLILGTGVFVGIGIAADVAAADAVWALTFAAVVALGNSWVEVANVTPPEIPSHQTWLQFAAQSTLFLAKLTSGAAAALGVAGYLLSGLYHPAPIWLVPIALLVIVGLTRLSWRGRSLARLRRVTVMIAAVSLLGLIGAGLLKISQTSSAEAVLLAQANDRATPIALLQATTLMTAAYAGFESLAPQPNFRSARQLLSAIGLAIGLAWSLYLAVAIVGIQTVGAGVLGSSVTASAAPLVMVMRSLALPGGVYLITLGAVAAMSGMILSLLPQLTERLQHLNQAVSPPEAWPNQEAETLSPQLALGLVSLILSCILWVGDVQTIWSFSAFAFLLHYALMHWAALRQASAPRVCPRWLNGLGLVVCVGLAFWVEWSVWLVSLGLVALGLVWRGMMLWTDEQG